VNATATKLSTIPYVLLESKMRSRCKYDSNITRWVCPNLRASYFKLWDRAGWFPSTSDNAQLAKSLNITNPLNGLVHIVTPYSMRPYNTHYQVAMSTLPDHRFWDFRFSNLTYYLTKKPNTFQRGHLALELFDPIPGDVFNFRIKGWAAACANTNRTAIPRFPRDDAINATAVVPSYQDLFAPGALSARAALAFLDVPSGDLLLRVRHRDKWYAGVPSMPAQECATVGNHYLEITCNGTATA
jgi:hypothetical protein